MAVMLSTLNSCPLKSTYLPRLRIMPSRRPRRTSPARNNAHPVSRSGTLLPVATKVHFIVSRPATAAPAEIAQCVKELGRKLPNKDIEEVVAYLKHLDLVTIE